VARVLLTGMSGTGKSTVLDELDRRGHRTLDTDYGGWIRADSRWNEPGMSRFLDEHPDVFVAGTVENQGEFYDRFDHVVVLVAPVEVIIARVAARANNPYGRTLDEQDEIRSYQQTVEPLLRQGATVEFDTTRLSAAELADELERLAAR
jgi:dephospho-CoA kinase